MSHAGRASPKFGQAGVHQWRRRHVAAREQANLADRLVDLVNEGFDCAVRVGDLPDSSLVSVRLGEMRRMVVASPAYLKRYGTPATLDDLAQIGGVGAKKLEAYGREILRVLSA